MEQAPFQKRPVDGIRPTNVVHNQNITTTKKVNKILLSKLLGVGFACILAFIIYNLYTEYTGLEDKDLIATTPIPQSNIDINDEENEQNSRITEQYIGVDVSNVNIDENIKIKSTKVAPFTDITFVVTKPDEGTYKFSSTSTVTGFAETNLNSQNLKKAGEYTITASAKGYISKNPQRFFLRHGKVSATESKIETINYKVKLEQQADIIVTILDKYKNPIPKHKVLLTSTRPDDDIEIYGKKMTDKTGVIHFKVSSKTEGKSYYLALDQDSGITLENKVEIQYTDSEKHEEGNEANSLSFLSTFLKRFIPTVQAAGEIAYYVIDSPAFFKVNEETEITVKAYDNTNNLLTGYLGRVEFKSSDTSSLIIPPDYTFTESDLGEHVFKITLKTPGSYLFTVSAIGNPSVKGEKQVIVQSDQNTEQGSLTKPQILSPPKGTPERTTVLSSSKIEIAGKADPEITIEIYDQDTKLGEVLSNASNLFFFQTDELVDGRHSLKVIAKDDEGHSISSDIVSVIIDTSNPIMLREALTIEPQQVKPGENVTFTIKTESGLDGVRIIVNQTSITLIESTSQAGTYIGTYTAPSTSGTFSVDVELKDSVSNPVLFKDQGNITVTETPEETQSVTTPVQPITPVPSPITPVPTQQTESGPAEILFLVFIITLPIGWVLIKN